MKLFNSVHAKSVFLMTLSSGAVYSIFIALLINHTITHQSNLNGQMLDQVANVSEHQIIAISNNDLGLMFLISCLAVAMLAALNYFIIKKIFVKPIVQIQSHLSAIARGEYKKKLKLDCAAEVLNLVDSVNLLANELQERTVSKNYLDNIIESMADTIVVVVEENSITRVNRATTKLLGYSAYELIGVHLGKLFGLESGKQYLNAEEETSLYLYHSVCDLEKYFLTKSGNRIPVLFSVSLIRNSSGAVDGIVCVAQEISKRKEAENALLQTRDQALRLAELKSQFLANMSHEIRTPLNGIKGMAELLCDSKLTAEQHDLLDSIIISADSLADIVNDVLDFSKIEAGKLELCIKPFNLRSWFKAILKSMDILATKKEIEIVGSIHSTIPSIILADSSRIQQILVNLIGNAIKFTPAKGGIFIYIDKLSQEQNLIKLKFSVSDSGIGIEKEKLEDIFKPFQQADGSIARQFGGTGLGLTICKALVQQMKGSIRVESIFQMGSTFHVELELGYVEEAESYLGKYELLCEKLKNLKILLIDENQANANNLQSILGKWGVSVSYCKSWPEAIDLNRQIKLGQQKYDLVIANLSPNDNLIDCKTRVLAEIEEDIPGMFLVASKNTDFQTPYEADCSTYIIPKPATNSALLDGIITLALKTDLEFQKCVEPIPRNRSKTAIGQTLRQLEILVAEDNQINQKLIKALLEKKGHKVAIVNNGFEVLNKLEEQKFDLIFMDIQMPSMGGDIATQKIRDSDKSYSKIPIIALTAHAMIGDRERYLELGMSDYVTKPIDKNQLYRAINDVIE